MRRILTPILFRPWWRLSRGLTLGVRAIVAGNGQVLLVRHSYTPGWYLPGGGVERGETVTDALTREVREEGNIVLEAAPRLLGVYSNEEEFSGDHVVLFLAEKWRQDGARTPNAEIREARFFPVDGLPQGATPATKRRIAEVFAGVAPNGRW